MIADMRSVTLRMRELYLKTVFRSTPIRSDSSNQSPACYTFPTQVTSTKSNFMRTKPFISLLLFMSFVTSLVPSALAIDEGMFTPSQIEALNLKKRGLKIDPKDIWNPGNSGLTDAIIRLNAGQGSCTAEFV